jgi:glycosyltransferase involved in cell wall biosynthesis
MKFLKILIVVESHSTSAGGGPVYWAQLSSWLIRRGHEVKILSGYEPGISFASPNTIGALPVGSNLRRRSFTTLFQRFLFSLQLIPIVESFACRWQPDIIHTVPPIASKAALTVGKRLKVPVIGSILSHIEAQWRQLEKNSFKRTIFQTLERRGIHGPYTQLICLTKRSQQVLIAEGMSPNQVTYIPHAVDITKFHERNPPKFRNQLKLAADTFILGYAGALTPDKGIDQLIQALGVLESDYPLHLILAGGGAWRRKLEELAARLELNNITFLGRLEFDEMPAFMTSLDLFVIPSYTETLPTSLLEALASGTPVMATNVGGVREFFQNRTGIVLSNSQHTTIAKTLTSWLNRRAELQKMGELGRQVVIKSHSWERTSQLTEEVYYKCLQNRNK